MYALTVFCSCVDVMVMSSAYRVSCSGAGGCGMSDVYMLSVGEDAVLRDASFRIGLC